MLLVFVWAAIVKHLELLGTVHLNFKTKENKKHATTNISSIEQTRVTLNL